jgi:hypothetical protein
MEIADRDDEFFGLVSLYPRRTGLPMTVWAGARGKGRHAPRLIVSTSHGDRTDLDSTAIVGIVPTPHLIAGSLSARDRAAVFAWIRLNRDVLLEHWEGDIDGGEMADRSRPVP